MAESPADPIRPDPAIEAEDLDPLGGQIVAGMQRRFWAYVIDTIIILGAVVVIAAALASVGLSITRFVPVDPTSTDPNRAMVIEYNYLAAMIAMALAVIASGLYYAARWTTKGSTIGQSAANILACDYETGENLTLVQALKRWYLLGLPLFPIALLMPVVWLAYVTTGIFTLWAVVLLIGANKEPLRRGLHDRYSSSVVVRMPEDVPAD